MKGPLPFSNTTEKGISYSPVQRIILQQCGLQTMGSDWAHIAVTMAPSGAAMFPIILPPHLFPPLITDSFGDSMCLITGSADQSAKLWNVQTGAQLYSFNFDSPARSVDFSVGDKLAVITTDPFMEQTSAIHIKRIAMDPSEQSGESVLTIRGPQGRINRAVWGPLNKTIISGGEDSVVRIWDSETGKLLKESDKETGHQKTITSLSKSSDSSHFLTGSLDKSAKLWDMRTLTLIKTYVTECPVNACAIAPLLDNVVIGGGQDASHVTTTDHRAGKFEAKFFHKILQEEIGGVKGHFGPINALAFNPDGKSFSSGGEDGYVRLHHFDSEFKSENVKYRMVGC